MRECVIVFSFLCVLPLARWVLYIYISYLQEAKAAHFTIWTRVTCVFCTFFFFFKHLDTSSCHVSVIIPDRTCALKYQMSCRLLAGCTVQSILSSASVKCCSLKEVDPAVVGHWYFCYLLNSDICIHSPVSSLSCYVCLLWGCTPHSFQQQRWPWTSLTDFQLLT